MAPREDTVPGTVETTFQTSMCHVQDDERAMIQGVLRDIEILQQGLGAERERHHAEIQRLEKALDAERSRGRNEEMRMVQALTAARRRYSSLVDVLAQRHVANRPGKYDFRPEIGAFVETR